MARFVSDLVFLFFLPTVFASPPRTAGRLDHTDEHPERPPNDRLFESPTLFALRP